MPPSWPVRPAKDGPATEVAGWAEPNGHCLRAVLCGRRLLRELGHLLSLASSSAPPPESKRVGSHREVQRRSRVGNSFGIARPAKRASAPAPPGARCACRACGHAHCAAFLRPPAACIAGAARHTFASRHSHPMSGAGRTGPLRGPRRCRNALAPRAPRVRPSPS